MANSDSTQRSQYRLFGAPRPEKFMDTPTGQALAASAKIHFDDKKDQEYLCAIEKLALDILADSSAARAFTVNPDEYMRQAGFSDIKIDLNSHEVRVAMALALALGDPDVQHAARRGDVDGFIDAIIAQGIKPIDNQLAIFAFAAVEVAVYFSAAAYTVETAVAVHHQVGVAARAFLDAEHHKNMLSQIAERVGSTNTNFVRSVRSRSMERIVEEYAKLHQSVEGNK